MLIICPVADLNVTILEVTQGGSSELATLSDNLCTGVVLDTLRGLTLRQLHELVDQDVLQVADLGLILLVDLCERDLILLLRLTVLDGTCKQFLVDHDTSQRRVGLQ